MLLLFFSYTNSAKLRLYPRMGIFEPILIRMRVENILIGNDEKKTECQIKT